MRQIWSYDVEFGGVESTTNQTNSPLDATGGVGLKTDDRLSRRSDSPFERVRWRQRRYWGSAARRANSVDICAPARDVSAVVLPPMRGQPIGHVTVANSTTIRGWAMDPDHPSAQLVVQILLDGVVWEQQLADGPGDSHRGHGFSWVVNQILGSAKTNHSVQVVALGVDNATGYPDGIDAVLPGSASPIPGSCHAIPEDCGPPGGTPAQEQCALGAWCYDVPCYWQNRHAETQYVENSLVRVGINTAFGGTMFALHRVDSDKAKNTTSYSRNLILEHGGAAVQLSIWGYLL